MSAPVGATRLQGELATGDPLSEADRSAIRSRTMAVLVPVRSALAGYPGVTTRTVVSGGTARALARLAMARTRGRTSGRSSEVNQVELPTGQVAELASQLARLDLKERLALPGMPSRRAPMLPIGATILETFALELGVDHFVVSEWGLREGALLDAIARYAENRGTPPSRGAGQRLARLLAQDPVHLGTAGRAGALGGTPTVGQFDLVAIELPLLPTFNAVALVRSHVGLLASAAPRQGVGSKLPPGVPVHVDARGSGAAGRPTCDLRRPRYRVLSGQRESG